MKNKLTCIVNVRNGERFLEQTLLSVLSQAEVPSILVVDNQSNDRTSEIARSFREVRYEKTPAPLTLGAARNFSLSLVETPFLTWLDADDLWAQNFTTQYAAVLDSQKNAVMFSSGSIIIDPQGKALPPKYQRFLSDEEGPATEPGDNLQRFIRNLGFRDAWCSYVFRTSYVRAVGGIDSGFAFAEDLDLIGRLLQKGDGVHIRKNLTFLRYHPEQLTRKLPPNERSEEIFRSLKNASVGREVEFEKDLARAKRILGFKKAAQTWMTKPFSIRQGISTLRSLLNISVLGWLFHPEYFLFLLEQMGFLKSRRASLLSGCTRN